MRGRPSAALLLAALAPASCLRVAPVSKAIDATTHSRRDALAAVFSLGVAASSSTAASAATVASAADMQGCASRDPNSAEARAPMIFTDAPNSPRPRRRLKVKKLAVKAKALRNAVREQGEGAKSRVAKEKESVLEPLRVAMAAAAPGLKEGLTDEQFESAELQPVLLKGHLFELGDALERGQWEMYTSKTTKATYPGAR